MFFKVLLDMRLNLRAIFTVCFSLVLGTSFGAYAQTVAPQPCGANYWTTLENRAWLEAEREIMQNQNLIFKPDSVLEYVCFDTMVDHVAQHAGNIFSHTNYFGEDIVGSDTQFGLRNSLERAVALALRAYNEQNFSHTFLGGRAADSASGITGMGMNPSDHRFDGRTRLGTYACGAMSAVWQTAKCANFNGNSSFQDGFYPLDALGAVGGGSGVSGYRDADRETRIRPSSCGASFTAWDTFMTAIESHNNTSFQIPLRTIYTDVYNRTRPGACGAAISTGITVYTSSGEHQDGVCTNPGCTYSAPASGSGTGSCS